VEEVVRFMHERKQLWAEGFRSLYYSLRHRLCPYFYAVFSTFEVLFLAAGIGGHQRETALINRSTRGFRLYLSSQGITFNAPLLEEKEKQPTHLAELKALAAALPTGSVVLPDEETKDDTADNTLVSMLLFQGHEEVHGLFDFLLNYKWEGDVPVLYSSHPFANCALRKLQLTYNGNFSRTSSDGKIETLKKIDLEGFIPPDQCMRLADVLKKTQQASFELTFHGIAGTAIFNFCPDPPHDPTPTPPPLPSAFSCIPHLPPAMLERSLLTGALAVNRLEFDAHAFKFQTSSLPEFEPQTSA
jgi:hypothetical protein